MSCPTPSSLTDLGRIAATYGVTLHAHHIDDALGFYSAEESRIYVEIDLTPNEWRSVIAHELGHVHYGHDCGSPKAERQADAYAADLLIDPSLYAEAEQLSHDPHDLADSLGVTVDVIHAFRTHHLQRLGRRTYGIRHSGKLTNDLARSLD